MSTVQTSTDHGRVIDVRVAIGKQTEDSTELHLLGSTHFLYSLQVLPPTGPTVIRGTTTVRAGRDTLDAHLFRCDTGERIDEKVTEDIVYAIFAVLDGEEDGIIAQEMRRICE